MTQLTTDREQIEETKDDRLVLSLNSHSLDYFQDCSMKYKFTQIENLEPKVRVSKGMSKGTLWHGLQKVWNECIQEYNKDKVDKKAYEHFKFNLHKVCIEWFHDNCPPEIEIAEKLLILRRFAEYRKKYPEINEKIIAVEQGFTKELYRDAYIIIVYEGRLDLLIQRADKTIVWIDYKTQHARYTWDLYQYSNQFLGYTWAIGNNHGIIDYTTWTQTINERTLRTRLHTYDSRRIKRWEEQTIEWAHRIVRTHIMEDFIETRSSCDGKYGLCPFTPICDIEPAFRERVKKNEFNKIEPYRSW